MKKRIVTAAVVLALIGCFGFSAGAITAEEIDNSFEELKGTLSDKVLADMELLGISGIDPTEDGSFGFSSLTELIGVHLGESASAPMACGALVMAVLILSGVVNSYTDSLRRAPLKETTVLVTALSTALILVTPLLALMNDAMRTVRDTANVMLVYFPIMVGILAFSGHAVSASGYYAMVMTMSEVLAQLSTRFIAPMLSVYLGLAISSSLSDKLRFQGLSSLFSKVIKWSISFLMTVFTALLTIRSMITTAYDSVGTRAVRFTLSSFIPLVGAALSEAYKTISGSIGLLRSGYGVFVIVAIIVAFLPLIMRVLFWLLSLNICRYAAALIGSGQEELLGSMSSVVSTLFAVIICMMAAFVISTAVLIRMGGGG